MSSYIMKIARRYLSLQRWRLLKINLYEPSKKTQKSLADAEKIKSIEQFKDGGYQNFRFIR